MITRDTAEEAWAEAQRLLAAIDPAAIADGAGGAARASESVGQQRMLALHGGDASRRALEVAPEPVGRASAWSAAAPGTALVGSHEEVADRIEEYHALGIDEFILSGYPHLEEAYWFGEGVMPILRERGLLKGAEREALAV